MHALLIASIDKQCLRAARSDRSTTNTWQPMVSVYQQAFDVHACAASQPNTAGACYCSARSAATLLARRRLAEPHAD